MFFRWKPSSNHYTYTIFISLLDMKKRFTSPKRDSAIYILQKKAKRVISGFTLMELVIVLVIIGILMGVTMKFSSNRIVDLKAQSLKETFVDNYQAVQSQNLASSYHGNTRYSKLTIAFDTTKWIIATFDGSWATQLLPDMDNIQLQLTWAQTLSLTPYHMGCPMLGWSTGLSFDLEVNKNKTYCFSIASSTCSLKENICSK